MPIDDEGPLVLAASDNEVSLMLSPLEQYGRYVAKLERVGKICARHHLWDMEVGFSRFLGELAEDWRGWEGGLGRRRAPHPRRRRARRPHQGREAVGVRRGARHT